LGMRISETAVTHRAPRFAQSQIAIPK
jgi:hypothetical protein